MFACLFADLFLCVFALSRRVYVFFSFSFLIALSVVCVVCVGCLVCVVNYCFCCFCCLCCFVLFHCLFFRGFIAHCLLVRLFVDVFVCLFVCLPVDVRYVRFC